MSRDIGLNREDAQALFDVEWALVRDLGAQMSARDAELSPRSHSHDSKWLGLEKARLNAIHAANEVRDSGVIPWMKGEHFGATNPGVELWAARALRKAYHVSRRGEYDPIIVVTTQSRQHTSHIQMTKEQAEGLRDQLIEELEQWDAELAMKQTLEENHNV